MTQKPDRPKHIDWPLLERYMANDLPPADVSQVDAVLADQPAVQRLIEEYRAAAKTVTPRPNQADVETALAQLHDRLDTMGENAGGVPSSVSIGTRVSVRDRAARYRLREMTGGRTQILRRWTFGVGAGVALALGLVTVWRVQTRPAEFAGPGRTYMTGAGQRATLTLGDGSRVTLAPRTRLTVPRDFSTAASRTVQLDGQAHFDVVPNVEHPFSVRTGASMTRVLGTSFDIRRYADDPELRVVVVTGKVAVESEHLTVVRLTAGMMGRVTDSTAVVTAVPNATMYTRWTTGHLDFQEAPVPEVLSTLSRWYGVEFQIADSTLSHRRVTAALDYAATTDLVVALETILNVSATTTTTDAGPIIILRPRPSRSRAAPSRREGHSIFSSHSNEVGR